MGRLSLEKIEIIRKAYKEDPNATKVADKVGVDARTVRKHVREVPLPSDRDTQQSSENRGKSRQKSKSSRAYQLLKKGTPETEIAIKLDIRGPEVEEYSMEYYRMEGLDALEDIHHKLPKNGLEAAAELICDMNRYGMEAPEYAEKMRKVNDLENIDKHVAFSQQQLAIYNEKVTQANTSLNNLGEERRKKSKEIERMDQYLTSLQNQCTSKEEDLKKLDLLWENKIESYIERRVTEEFDDASGAGGLLAKAAIAVLRDEEKYNSIKDIDLDRPELHENQKRLQVIVNEIVARYRKEFESMLRQLTQQAVRRIDNYHKQHEVFGRSSTK